jgi:hypothetical protein
MPTTLFVSGGHPTDSQSLSWASLCSFNTIAVDGDKAIIRLELVVFGCLKITRPRYSPCAQAIWQSMLTLFKTHGNIQIEISNLIPLGNIQANGKIVERRETQSKNILKYR